MGDDMATGSMLRKTLLTGAVLLLAEPAAARAQVIAPGTQEHLSPTAPSEAPPGAVDPSNNQVSEIVVTATKMGATALQKTPLAISAFTPAMLDQLATNDIRDLAQLAPSINVGTVYTSAAIYIRGIGTNAVLNGSDPDVALNVDGIYLARAFEQFTDFFDVDRVEILRGPQGTIYGRNAVGGVVNIVSKAPSDQFTGKEQVTFGDYGNFQEQGFVSGPLIKGVLAGSVAINYLRHDPYDRNVVPGKSDVFDANHGGVRAQLRWTPTPWIDATTRVDYSQLSENIQNYDHLLAPEAFPTPLALATVGKYFDVALSNPGTHTQVDEGVSEEINLQLNPFLTLKSISALRRGSYKLNIDVDATEAVVQNTYINDTSDQISQELDLNGKFSKLDFVAGLYYFDEHQHGLNSPRVPPSFTPAPQTVLENILKPDANSTSAAVFAQATYHLPDHINLTVGGRYTQDQKKFAQDFSRYVYTSAPTLGPLFPGFPVHFRVDPTFDAFTPKVGIDWQAASSLLFYASYTQGFKSGGNNYTALTPVGITYQPEKVTSYESGIKTQWLQNRLRLNLTVFDYDYTDLQVQSLLPNATVSITNAASATIRGVEVESVAQLSSDFSITANATYLHDRYDKFPTSTVATTLVPYLLGDPNYNSANHTYNAQGNRLNNAPDFAYTISARYNHTWAVGEVYANVEYHWQDRTYFDPSNVRILSQAAYGILNLSVGYRTSDHLWDVSLIARNATDQGYFGTIVANANVPSAVSGAPRTILLRVARDF